MTISRKIAFFATAALAVQAPVAQAADAPPCVSEAEISAAAVYAMPSILTGFTTKCSAKLSRNGFLATRGKAMSDRYAALQTGAWPRARSLIFKFATKGASGQNASTIASLSEVPGEALRPLVDALIAQEIAKRVAVKDCGTIEKILSALEPLDPAATANLVAAVFAVTKPANPSVCPEQS